MARKEPKLAESQVGDLVSLSSTDLRPAYIVKRSEVGELTHGSGRYVPHEIIALWMGRELINLGVDHEECDVIMFEGELWAVLYGSIQRLVSQDEPNS